MARISGTTSANFRAAAKRIVDAGKKIDPVWGNGVRMIGEEIMTDVKASRQGHGVPVKDGHLRASGMVEGPRSNGEVELSFGNEAVQYALIQHEREDYHHTVGEVRYLVRGVERWTPGGSAAMEALRRQTEEALGGG